MRNLLPKAYQFSMIDLEGPDAKEYAQRLFSRDFRNVPLGSGRLCLFLSAEARVQAIFWAFVEKTGVRLFVRSAEALDLFNLIEKYHFAEKFQTLQKSAVVSFWAPSKNGGGIGEKKDNHYVGFWRSTSFEFDLENTTAEIAPEIDATWEDHRLKNEIPQLKDIPTDRTLVFTLQLDELCDFAKGCYIGQEVVERVRTRKLKI